MSVNTMKAMDIIIKTTMSKTLEAPRVLKGPV